MQSEASRSTSTLVSVFQKVSSLFDFRSNNDLNETSLENRNIFNFCTTIESWKVENPDGSRQVDSFPSTWDILFPHLDLHPPYKYQSKVYFPHKGKFFIFEDFTPIQSVTGDETPWIEVRFVNYQISYNEYMKFKVPSEFLLETPDSESGYFKQ